MSDKMDYKKEQWRLWQEYGKINRESYGLFLLMMNLEGKKNDKFDKEIKKLKKKLKKLDKKKYSVLNELIKISKKIYELKI